MTIKSAVKKFLDWSILLLWLVASSVIFLFTANLQRTSSAILLLIFVVFAVVPITGCLIALRHRKHAGHIFLVNGALVACFVIGSAFLDWAADEHPIRSLLVILGIVAAYFVVPALYWLITARRQWPSYLQRSFSPWTKLALVASGLLVLITGSALMGIYQVLYYGDCSPRLFDSPKSPDHSVYTAKIIYVHHSSKFTHLAGIVAWFPWSVARTEHEYWGLSGWKQTFTILPYRNFRVDEVYLIEGHIRPSLIGRLLNLMDTNCSRVAPVSESTLELHLLQSGPVNDGARIVGQILKEDSAGKREPIPHLAVTLVLHHGPEIIALTDAQGIFDYPRMSPGEYDIYLRSLPATARVEDVRRCSSGMLVAGGITDCTLVISAASLSQ